MQEVTEDTRRSRATRRRAIRTSRTSPTSHSRSPPTPTPTRECSQHLQTTSRRAATTSRLPIQDHLHQDLPEATASTRICRQEQPAHQRARQPRVSSTGPTRTPTPGSLVAGSWDLSLPLLLQEACQSPRWPPPRSWRRRTRSWGRRPTRPSSRCNLALPSSNP